ncbi:MFS transporter [soil metagenome]
MTIFGYIVFEETESNFLLGLFSFMQMAPSLLLAPVVGVIVDTFERRRILATVFTVQTIGFAILALLEFSNALTVPAIGVLVVIMGIAMAFAFPASSALVPMLIPRRALQSAIAANSMLMNTSRIAAPALTGIAISGLGVGLVMVSGAALYLPAIFIILSIPMSIVAVPGPAEDDDTIILRGAAKFFGDLRDVISYIRANNMLRASLVNDIVPFGFGMAYIALLPSIALDTLDGNAGTLGLLHGVGGAGSLLGTFAGASVAGRMPRGLVIWSGMIGWGGGLVLLALSASYLVILPALMLTGLFQTLYIVQNDTLVQTFAEDRYRGRVIAAQSMINALRTLGFLIIGTLAALTSVSLAIAAFGLAVVGMGVATLLFRPGMRDLR